MLSLEQYFLKRIRYKNFGRISSRNGSLLEEGCLFSNNECLTLPLRELIGEGLEDGMEHFPL